MAVVFRPRRAAVARTLAKRPSPPDVALLQTEPVHADARQFASHRGPTECGCSGLDSQTVGAENQNISTNQPLSDPMALPVIETVLGTVPPDVLARSPADTESHTGGWKALEERIAAWAPAKGEPDERSDEDGYLLPNSKTVAVALEIAARLRKAGVDVPMRSGQTANGGINFEWRGGNCTERLTVNARGEAELTKFEESRLVLYDHLPGHEPASPSRKVGQSGLQSQLTTAARRPLGPLFRPCRASAPARD
ncbi:MAG TPA: hypothetical protein VFI31_05700 [Pirellulales bacterium]|nr:hypothetical protein [Pirellulales bacterium]